MKLSNFWVERNARVLDTRIFATRESRKKSKDWKIRRKEWPKCERKKRERERERVRKSKWSTGPIVVREFARQEHYQEKMFRDCAFERDVFGSLVRFSQPPAPEDCPASSLSTTLSRDHYPAAFLAVLSSHLFPPSVSIETSCRSCEERGEENQHRCILGDATFP